MATGIILQARTGSTRLPQKMILPFFEKKGILETLIIRLIGGNLNVPIILATSNNPNDDEIENIGLKLGIKVFRGSENNVLERYICAAKFYNLNKLIRICADNLFLELGDLKNQIEAFEKSDFEYWCYCKSDLTPTIKTHYGFWAEGVRLSALIKIAGVTNEIIFQEHVTNYIYTHPDNFEIHFQQINEFIENSGNIRLTIDTINDFNLAQEIYSELIQKKIPLNAIKIVQLVKTNPIWLNQMKHEISKNSK